MVFTMDEKPNLSRRDFLSHSTVLGSAALAAGVSNYSLASTHSTTRTKANKTAKRPGKSQAPFKDLREYLDHMEEHGLLLRFDGVDQDAYECTAIMYRLMDLYGQYNLPVVVFENIKIDGQWITGPIVANHQSHHQQEALVWGLEPDWVEPKNSYRKALQYMVDKLDANNGNYPEIKPVMVNRDQAPCKEIVVEADDIDITQYAFIQGNPGDAGRYINTGSTFSADPEWGQNFGTYRCEIKGPRKILLNSEPNQTCNRMINRAIKRGDKTYPIALVIGQDPATWVVSGSRVPTIPKKPVDELAIAGGLQGKAIEVIKADLSDLTIPAHCEMVMEGTIDLTKFESEGPYHETYGYLGDKNDERFIFNIDRITHRKNPILLNSFTSIGGGFVRAPMDAFTLRFWQKRYPQITGIYYHDDTKGINYISIKKDRPGLGLEIAKAVSERFSIVKIAVVVDDDLDIMNQSEMLLALGSRWQPSPASSINPNGKASFFEPSSPDGKTSSKIAIDATMQWPEEGGPKEFPALNRNLFEQAAPTGVENVVKKFGGALSTKRF